MVARRAVRDGVFGCTRIIPRRARFAGRSRASTGNRATAASLFWGGVRRCAVPEEPRVRRWP